MKPVVDSRWLIRFFAAHWVFILASGGGTRELSCAPLFYAFAMSGGSIGESGTPLLVFASNPNSEHGQCIGSGPTPVAAAVAAEATEPGAIRGVQLRGSALPLRRLPRNERIRLRGAYLRRHPIAAPLLLPGRQEQLYLLLVTHAKATDNRWGLGVHPVRTWNVDWSRVLDGGT